MHDSVEDIRLLHTHAFFGLKRCLSLQRFLDDVLVLVVFVRCLDVAGDVEDTGVVTQTVNSHGLCIYGAGDVDDLQVIPAGLSMAVSNNLKTGLQEGTRRE